MQLIDGNAIAESIIEELTQEVSALPGKKPVIAVIRVGEDPASVSYVRKKEKTAARIGIGSRMHILPEDVSKEDLFAQIDALNADPDVSGILIQAPLPNHIDETETFNRVLPGKDVDGFNTVNIGKLCQEDNSGFVACTPAGIVQLIKRSGIETEGKHVVVLGRSQIVGKPAALLMMQKACPGNATVTVCHSRTADLPSITRQADVLIAAIGRPNFVTEDMVKDGVNIIDVGINRVEDASKKSGYRLVGDVEFATVAPKCAHITPVPGGVGPMTVAMLMYNTLSAFKASQAEG
ncbi:MULTISPECIES: bifunctional methylenetetrahydrofolate dehydrogenase/methenyltetrahydrofolate cyclohydrolase FolD [unclassified Lentimonas]|uniref:bifunctional methylenetetrahydrofolate dehydrogenase/methenyltetrahydrofolate cyclohydrolase FolD n=1 Tax=unclassified Lentimonas TaxID=2630993 RepID=UPI001320CE48|nr:MULTISPECIES: bifunctional methylenetetrahydrofolate dehydrogenase/methenyltetrahydrofolate cyclohydrolase FolD [unclassified Lentimonas]CAA6678901.1 Methylenetetrahydrofolate dehydrogenase (NADP+) (EC / Methenyltetrahydrofolate cyclohydrolase (EC [Lentimonas sp. CC4]CAA6684507.1 Methylenetetrahydrofolate dehydrogenase (NADP+) (EC / Methenyltetrahydrofolate cyclohydrolase (EC [Lentimonas sp. CC6]CAA6693825.1 Methylenetetrahydrofolate dehydrogenase (NADP+) (EC / Methenyltetrahydrofolate cycloh